MRSERESLMTEVRSRLETASYLMLADCRGMKSEQLRELRSQLRGAKTRVTVAKNTIIRIAAKDLGWDDSLSAYLSGPTAMVWGNGDVVQVAKILKNFIKGNNKLPLIKGGRVEGKTITAKDVDALAEMPPREVLVGQLVCTIAAPLSGLVGVMQQKVASLLYALNAVAKKKSAQSN